MANPPSLASTDATVRLPCEVGRAILPWMVVGLGGCWEANEDELAVVWTTEEGAPQRISAPDADWAWHGVAANRLREAFATDGRRPHAQPTGQPTRVHEISEALLQPYEAADGRVHLGGCTLEWLPVYREFCIEDDEGVPVLGSETRYFDAEGEKIEDATLAQLSHLSPMSEAPAHADGPKKTDSFYLTIWRTWARGRVVAEIDEQSLTVDVEGWAAEIADGSISFPPFDIGSGDVSHCAALDDDGEIGPATAIEQCVESGRRLLCSKLQRCGASQVWVAPKHIQACPVSGVGVRQSELVECNMCRKHVAPQAMSSGRCEVCRTLKAVAKEDAQVSRIIGEFPRLDSWSAWRIGENRDSWVLTAGRFLWRLLIVVKKEPLEITHAATGLRWIRGWTNAPEKLLRELRETV